MIDDHGSETTRTLTAAKRPVLVVEDHPSNRELVCVILRAEGFAVVEAANGREALDLLLAEGRNEPCLIVTDLDMPVMSGWELLAIVKAYYRLSSIPVVVITGSGGTIDALRCGEATALFLKPFDVPSLVAKVRELAHPHCNPRTTA